MDTTGEIIRRLRREKGLTQLALANLLHLSDRTVSKWECGRSRNASFPERRSPPRRNGDKNST